MSVLVFSTEKVLQFTGSYVAGETFFFIQVVTVHQNSNRGFELCKALAEMLELLAEHSQNTRTVFPATPLAFPRIYHLHSA